MRLTDAQWDRISHIFPKPKRRPDGRGRPRVSTLSTLEGILWILRTGARWQDLPKEYPPYQTCHRYFQQWSRDGTLEKVLKALAEQLAEEGKLDFSESFIDGTFSGAKKGAIELVQRSAAKGPRSWQSQTAMVFLSPSGLKALRHMR